MKGPGGGGAGTLPKKKVKPIQLFDFLNFGIFTEIVSISVQATPLVPLQRNLFVSTIIYLVSQRKIYKSDSKLDNHMISDDLRSIT